MLYTRTMKRLATCMRASLLVLLFPPVLHAQWELENGATTANLRGVVSVNEHVAWASGSAGTVLRTLDAGHTWLPCSKPAGAEKLDFRGVQAWDENTGIAMSAGPGELSRIYKTADGCRTWTLLLTNPDKDGFWDAIRFTDARYGVLLGDPVNGHFVLLTTTDGGTTWKREAPGKEAAVHGESIFAASNSSLLVNTPGSRAFCTGGENGAMVHLRDVGPHGGKTIPGEVPWGTTTSTEELERVNKSSSAGCFSIATNHDGRNTIVAVGGDFAHPDDPEGTAWTTAGDASGSKEHPLFRFSAAKVMPHGYRSAVSYDSSTRSWIAVGPNGTDVSSDDGWTWRALRPGAGEPTGTDGPWNALSLPFAVGPTGRIGRLIPGALELPKN